MDNQAAAQPLVIWLLIITSVLLVTGITYVYTNRNWRVTWIFTLISIVTIALIKIFREVDSALHSQFIGRYNGQSTTYIAIQPGWDQIFKGWHIWILPVAAAAILLSIVFYFIFRYIKTAPAPATIIPSSPALVPTASSKKLGTFLAVDSAKRESQEANEKLAETLLMCAAQEIQTSDLRMDLRSAQRELEKIKKNTGEKLETLKLELAAKTRENERLSIQLKERAQEIDRFQQMIEKMMQGKP